MSGVYRSPIQRLQPCDGEFGTHWQVDARCRVWVRIRYNDYGGIVRIHFGWRSKGKQSEDEDKTWQAQRLWDVMAQKKTIHVLTSFTQSK